MCFFLLPIFVLFCWKTCICTKKRISSRKNCTIKCQLVHIILYTIIILFLVAFFLLLESLLRWHFYRLPDFILPASFSILSPRIIFTSVINKSALWTFFHGLCYWCCCCRCYMMMPILLLDARKKCHEGVFFFVLFVALCATASAAVPVSPRTWENRWDWNPFGNRTFQIYLNTYKDKIAWILRQWYYFGTDYYYIHFSCVCLCDDAHKSALRQWKFTVLQSERPIQMPIHVHIPIGTYHKMPINDH